MPPVSLPRSGGLSTASTTSWLPIDPRLQPSPVLVSATGSATSDDSPASQKRRVHSRVALHLLEALRDQDIPAEILDDENVSITLPRRLGLSHVVDAQIRRYREDARRRRRIPDQEVQDLIGLVIRRPDSKEVFLRVGAQLHGGPADPGWRKALPRRLAQALARRGIRQRLAGLFGRGVVGSMGAPLDFEATDDLLVESDPGGDACAIVTGLARVELSRLGEAPERFVHDRCRGRGDAVCTWTLEEDLADD